MVNQKWFFYPWGASMATPAPPLTSPWPRFYRLVKDRFRVSFKCTQRNIHPLFQILIAILEINSKSSFSYPMGPPHDPPRDPPRSPKRCYNERTFLECPFMTRKKIQRLRQLWTKLRKYLVFFTIFIIFGDFLENTLIWPLDPLGPGLGPIFPFIVHKNPPPGCIISRGTLRQMRVLTHFLSGIAAFFKAELAFWFF